MMHLPSTRLFRPDGEAMGTGIPVINYEIPREVSRERGWMT
jgi:hypothetical protein